MRLEQAPSLLHAVTVCAYWACVAVMIVRVSRRARVQRVLVPAQRREQLMWLVWGPLILTWLVLPFAAAQAAPPSWAALPNFLTHNAAYLFARFSATAVGFWCLLMSIRCWRHMGRHWRMSVDPTQEGRLFVEGPFARVRHPIYALSILLILCSTIVVPVPLMLLIATVHITLMNLKARNEERFLLERHGDAYAAYCQRTGRFVPRGASLPPPPGLLPAHIPSPAGRLTPFQRAMMQWDDLHAYNAAHAIRLVGPSVPYALRRAINAACAEAGIGELLIDRSTDEYGYTSLSEVPLSVAAPADNPNDALQTLITVQMNEPFSPSPHHPLRWTVLDEADGAGHYLLLVYHHVAADARSVEALLAEVVRRYRGIPAEGAAQRITIRPTRSPATDGRQHRSTDLRGIRRVFSLYFRFRLAHKMPDERDQGDKTATILRSAPPGLIERLSVACRRRDVGMNDAFLAAFAAAIARHTPDRHTSRHRRKIAVGSVLGGRRTAADGDVALFGVRLSDMVLLLDAPDAPLDDLLMQIAAQTKARKSRRDVDEGALAMQSFVVQRIWPLLDIPHTRRSYRKLMPICGGVSTVVVDERRFAAPDPLITRYLRASPPGPAAPIALAPTVLGNHLELGLVYRLSCMQPPQAERFLADVLANLAELAAAASVEAAA